MARFDHRPMRTGYKYDVSVRCYGTPRRRHLRPAQQGLHLCGIHNSRTFVSSWGITEQSRHHRGGVLEPSRRNRFGIDEAAYSMDIWCRVTSDFLREMYDRRRHLARHAAPNRLHRPRRCRALVLDPPPDIRCNAHPINWIEAADAAGCVENLAVDIEEQDPPTVVLHKLLGGFERERAAHGPPADDEVARRLKFRQSMGVECRDLFE